MGLLIEVHLIRHFLRLHLPLAAVALLSAFPADVFASPFFEDGYLGLTQAELLDKVALPQPVRDALSGLPGPYTDALALVVLGDADANTEADEIALALERCSVAMDTYVAIAHEAADWAHQTISAAA